MVHVLRFMCYLMCNSGCLMDDLYLSHTEWTFLFYLFFSWSHSREIHSNRAMEAKVNWSEREIFQDNLACCLPANNQSPSEVFSGSQCHTLSQTSQFVFFFFSWGKLVFTVVPGIQGGLKKSELLLFLSSLWHLSFLCFPFPLFSLGFYGPGVFQSDLQDADFGLAQWGGSAPGPQTRTSLYRLGFCPRHRSHETDE